MFCKSCEYPLWNLSSRTCPECGTGFAPSEFDFRPESVRFCCPHCRQEYFGTSERGQLVPRAFACVKCHTDIDMDQMVMIPREGVQEQHTRAETLPWTARKRIGFFRGWFGTMGLAIGAPNRLIRAIPDHGAVPALWYCVLTQFVFGITGLSFLMLFPLVLGMAMAGGGAGGGFVGLALGLVGAAIGTLVGVALGVVLWAGLAHGLLLITGGARAGFGVTLSAISYASGANVLSAVPCLGIYTTPLGGLWWMIVGSIVVTGRQGVSGWRAALAVLAPPLGATAIGLALIIWWFASFAGAMGGALSGAGYAQIQSQSMVAALSSYYATNNTYPPHAGELMGSRFGFIDADSFRSEFMPPVITTDRFLGSASRDGLDVMTQPEIDQLVQDSIDAMPANVVAHAVGDFIFTYHGIDPTQGDASLWLFVALGPSNVVTTSTRPDGATITTRGPPDFILVTLLDNTTLELDPATWTQDLAGQNTVRASQGLPPLPDLLTVSPGNPGVSGGGGAQP